LTKSLMRTTSKKLNEKIVSDRHSVFKNLNSREITAIEDQDYFDFSSEDDQTSLKRKLKDEDLPKKKLKIDEE
jgi:hypothetical protein